MPRPVQRRAQPADDHAPDEPRIAEPHLGLGRVDVDVDEIGGNIQKQRGDGMPVAREHILIGGAECADEQPVLHRTPVDRSEEHTSELPSLMRISYAGLRLKQKKQQTEHMRYTEKMTN